MNKFTANSPILKAIVIGFLALMMLIPVSMLESLIYERQANKLTVYEEINSKWGGNQHIVGPILVIPYTKTYIDKEQKEITTQNNAYLLPEDLTITGSLFPEDRKRGIYNILVYQSELVFNGKFALSELSELNISPEAFNWKEAFMLIGISDMQGIKNKITFTVNDLSMKVEPGVKNNNIIHSGFTVKTPIDKQNPINEFNFNFNLSLNGTEKIHFSPIGKETHTQLNSQWGTVSFSGDFLPSKHTIEENQFTANWDIFDYNRNYPQVWTDKIIDIQSSKFGVDLIYPVDQYLMSIRSVKYAIMFIALTFMVFFLFELLSGKRIHPIQYLLVSFGLVLFYSLLMALSEHIGFDIAYLISSIAIVALISIYSKTIFGNKKRAGMMSLYLCVVYIYLYIILQLEDLALLFGSIGLFTALASIMYVSRKINWYKNENDEIKN